MLLRYCSQLRLYFPPDESGVVDIDIYPDIMLQVRRAFRAHLKRSTFTRTTDCCR